MNKKIDEVTLTAFALGELPENRHKEIAMEVQKDEKLQQEVKEIKAMAQGIEKDLGLEAKPRLAQAEREKLMGFEEKKGFFSWTKALSSISIIAVAGIIFTNVQKEMKNDLEIIDVNLANKVGATLEKKSNAIDIFSEINIDETKIAQKIVKTKKRQALAKEMAPMAEGRAMPQASFVGSAMMDKEIAFVAPYPTESEDMNTESYNKVEQNSWVDVLTKPLSTFSVDVDTASYSNTRRFLMQGSLPVPASVRLEEFINYFSYDYKAPTQDAKEPFNVETEVASSPWHENYKIVKIGIKGREVQMSKRPKSNLVFLLDTSGSMNNANKLPLLKQAMKLLVTKLGENDRISIVTYAGSSGVVLDSVNGANKAQILRSIDSLSASGGTNGESGIQLAYNLAQKGFIKGGINRVILATDGDFNLGTTNHDSLIELIKKKSDSKTFLTILGFGQGNYKDHQMESIANKGNGNYFYIDTYNEAKKVMVNDLSGTLMTIAKDVKIQVEFNPALVKHYRLIGYENRKMADKDFNDDKKDAGEIGAGHTVTALYEIVPSGVKFHGSKTDKLKYQSPTVKEETNSTELLTVKLRYKEPEGSTSKLIEVPVKNNPQEFSEASLNTKLAVSAASFGMILREDEEMGDMNMSKIQKYLRESLAQDKFGYRQEFLELSDLAKQINSETKKWK